MRRYELAPNGTQKSFYGKAVIEIDNAGNETLYSYNTPIIKRLVNGSLVRLWGGWSNTNQRHKKKRRRITVHFTDNGGNENES